MRIAADPAVAKEQWTLILALIRDVSNPAFRRFVLYVSIDKTDESRGAFEQLKQLRWTALCEELKRFDAFDEVVVGDTEDVGGSEVWLELEKLLRRALERMLPRTQLRYCKDSFLR